MRLLATVVSATLLLAGCGGEPERKHAPAAKAPIRVETAAVTRAVRPGTYEATGTVRSRASAAVASKLMGYAREVRGEIGERVREGQVLVVLDSRELDVTVQRAEAAREEVKGAIPEAESAIAGAKAQVDLAQVTFNRMQDLLGKRSVTQQEFDEASARLKSARASHEMARARRAQLDSKLSQIEQEVRAAGVNRTYATIAAPFSGVIVTKSIEPGALAVPGAPLFVIERNDAFRLEATVEESRLAMMRTGLAAKVALDGTDKVFAARVSEIVPSVDAASRTGTVKIDLPSSAGLRSGLFGRAVFAIGTQEALSIPSAAAMERGQLQSVYVVENNTARSRLVTLGAKFEDRVEVLSGLSEGERVVVPIPRDLTDGTAVEVRP